MKSPTPTPAVRFWHFTPRGGLVRFTLRPGQTIQLYERWHNGEGYSWESERITLDDGQLVNDYASGGTDCDGSSRTGGTSICRLDRLASRPAYKAPEILLPSWEKAGDAWNHDALAESANY